jgi:hypothetical protein
MLENFNDILQLIQVGAVGVMLGMTWRLMVKKDKQMFKMIEAQNKERKAMYQSMTELVSEVTMALTDKNHTDQMMSDAVKKLTDKLCDMKRVLKNN